MGALPKFSTNFRYLAQLVERRFYTANVKGSTPLVPTNLLSGLNSFRLSLMNKYLWWGSTLFVYLFLAGMAALAFHMVSVSTLSRREYISWAAGFITGSAFLILIWSFTTLVMESYHELSSAPVANDATTAASTAMESGECKPFALDDDTNT